MRPAPALAARRSALAMGSLAGALALGEGAVRLARLDEKAVPLALYYQGVELPMHEVSTDPVLRYVPRRGAHSLDGRASVGEHGAREPIPDRDARPRVLFFGGSTVWGTDVADGETLPAALERALAVHCGAAAVWNFGVSAYTEGQMLRLARTRLPELAPVDLVLMMVTNPGRRPFLVGTDLSRSAVNRLLDEDPGFLSENVPAPFGGPAVSSAHRAAFRHLVAWRAWSARRAASLDRDSPRRDPEITNAPERERFRREAASAGVTVVFVHYPNHHFPCPDCWRGDLEIDLESAGQGYEDRDLHPSPAVLERHALLLAEALLGRGAVRCPAAAAPPAG